MKELLYKIEMHRLKKFEAQQHKLYFDDTTKEIDLSIKGKITLEDIGKHCISYFPYLIGAYSAFHNAPLFRRFDSSERAYWFITNRYMAFVAEVVEWFEERGRM